MPDNPGILDEVEYILYQASAWKRLIVYAIVLIQYGLIIAGREGPRRQPRWNSHQRPDRPPALSRA